MQKLAARILQSVAPTHRIAARLAAHDRLAALIDAAQFNARPTTRRLRFDDGAGRGDRVAEMHRREELERDLRGEHRGKPADVR